MNKSTPAYNAGFAAKKQEISEMGFFAARDKFNLDCPVGVKWTGSAGALEYCKGEMAALEEAVSQGMHR